MPTHLFLHTVANIINRVHVPACVRSHISVTGQPLATDHRTGSGYIHVLMDLTQRRSAGLHPSQDLPVHAAGTNFRRRQPMSTPHHHATSPHAARYVSFNVLSTPNGQLHRLQVEACGLQLVDLPLQ